jgi:hypothetical protein
MARRRLTCMTTTLHEKHLEMVHALSFRIGEAIHGGDQLVRLYFEMSYWMQIENSSFETRKCDPTLLLFLL